MTQSIDKTRPAGSYLGDILRNEWHRSYCCVSGKLVNPNGAASGNLVGFNPIGQPVKASGANFVFVLATDEANAIGIVAYDKPITLAFGATSELPYLILRRGPALIDKDALPLKDVALGGGSAGTAFTVATLVTAYAALSPPIIAQVEVTPTKTQNF